MSTFDRTGEQHNDLVQSFLLVRRAIGVLGLFLPISLIVSGYAVDGIVQDSISAMYHTSAGDLLVGTMMAISVFLWSYVGYPRRPEEVLSDRLVSRLAALGAAGVALIPVSSAEGGPARHPPPLIRYLVNERVSDWLHYGAATLFFSCLTIFCLVLFRRGRERDPSRLKVRANRIYLACGLVLGGCLGVMLLYVLGRGLLSVELRAAIERRPALFIIETVGVVAFGISWLVKGRTLGAITSAARSLAG